MGRVLVDKNVKIFAGSSGELFARRMCSYLGVDLGKSEVITFSEKNTFVKVCETARSQDVFLIQPVGLDPNNEFVELLFWMDAFKRTGVKSVTAIIPYFSYAKGDKKDEPRVSIRARVCAECIELAGADRVITMELHSPQVQGFFKKPLDNLIPMPIFCEYIKKLDLKNLVVASPDEGYVKTARNYASYLGVPLVIGHKIRRDHAEKAEILDIVGDVKDKNVLIVDDFSISGGTLINMGEKLKSLGARSIYACLSHILLNEKGVGRLEDSVIEFVLSSDTITNPALANSTKVKILSMAPLFAETVKRIITAESVSELYEKVPPEILRQSQLYV